MIVFNPDSPAQLAKLFFGGEVKVKTKELVGKYKNGNEKYAQVEKIIKVKGLGLKPIKKTPTGAPSTDDSVLSIIARRADTEAGKIAKLLLKTRELNKQISTYYETTEELVYEHDSCVHPEFSHCGYERNDDDYGGGTATGRLSSRNINAQNQPGKPSLVKAHFTSRWGDEGVLMELDYKQIEVFVFAFLTQDTQLLSDLRNGVDIHKVMYANCYEVDIDSVTDSQRKGIKACTFHVIYGGGYKSMAKRMDLDEEFCKVFISKFYQRYPMAKVWQDNLVRRVENTATLNGRQTMAGKPQHRGYLKSITGRQYEFTTTDSPKFLQERGIETSFNPPDIKNYPVQGLATADIVLMMIGRLWRKAINFRHEFLLINTVHDSIILDCRKNSLKKTCTMVKHELQLVQEAMKRSFGIDFNLSVEVDCKVGHTWLDMKTYEVV